MAKPAKNKVQPKKGKNPKPKKVDPLEPLKLEIAKELGLDQKVKKSGWDSLSAREAGRIGGYMTQRLKAQRQSHSQSPS